MNKNQNGFIMADDLKKEYTVFGSFYDVKDPVTVVSDHTESQTRRFRNLLEIYHKSVEPAKNKTYETYKAEPELIVVMMNPGSSRPWDKKYAIPLLHAGMNYNEEEILKVKMVRAQPDLAQYQIMRFMKKANIQYARVINLSDLRDGNSDSAADNLNEIRRVPVVGCLHSIVNREEEFSLAIGTAAPILSGWGFSQKAFVPFIHKAMSMLPPQRIFGVKKENGWPCDFYYPSPSVLEKKLEWLKNIDVAYSNFKEGQKNDER